MLAASSGNGLGRVAVARCGLLPGPTPSNEVDIFIVNQGPEHKAVAVRVGIGDPRNPGNPGKEVAWIKIVPGTFQRLAVPAGSDVVALVLGPPDCVVHMEKPWTSSGAAQDTDPSNMPFFILGGVVDMSGWGLPITSSNPMPADVVEAPLQQIANPCPGELGQADGMIRACECARAGDGPAALIARRRLPLSGWRRSQPPGAADHPHQARNFPADLSPS